MSDSDVVDLDALVPASISVKFSNETIKIDPPKTGDIIRIGILGKKLQEMDEGSDLDQIEKLVTDLTQQVYNSIPALANRSLTTGQLLKLVEILSDMSMPPEVEALKAEGITTSDTDTPTPKAPQS